MFTFVRFLAWAFYWMRLELAALQQPDRELSVIRARGRFTVTFGESVGHGREAWQAIRHMLEGRDEREPLEFSPEAMAAAADELEELQGKGREQLEAEAKARHESAMLALEERERLEAALEAERERDAAAGRERATSGESSTGETPWERARRETLEAEERARAALKSEPAGDVAGGELAGASGAPAELVPDPQPRRGF